MYVVMDTAPVPMITGYVWKEEQWTDTPWPVNWILVRPKRTDMVYILLYVNVAC